MIEQVLPPAMAYAEAFADPPEIALFPEEEALVAQAVDERRREFATARACARGALATLGVPPMPILSGERGAPRWPPSFIGSITHCVGYRAAAVARSRDVLTAGIDAEPNDELPAGVLEVISLPAERARLRAHAAAAPSTSWDRLLFSAKESVYKAWFPLAGYWLGFQDAEIAINPTDGSFEAQLLVTPPKPSNSVPATFTGRWWASEGLILTAVTATV